MTRITNYLTIDVEDYFQVSAFEKVAPPDGWDSLPHRVEKNTAGILGILAERDIKATFFIVGWVAERYPKLVEKIAAAGHEIGCHSHMHRRVYELGPEKFRKDTQKAKATLEDIIGKPVRSYRAPSYSITKKSLWALAILQELGFTYDSSIFPIHHDIYGMPDAPRFTFTWDLSEDSPEIVYQPTGNHQPPTANSLQEFPISTALILGRKIPIAGGGYFRLFPYWFTKKALKSINEKERQPFIFYLHPWEIDPGQPRFENAGWKSRFRHYNNLEKTAGRFNRLLRDFAFGPITTEI